MQGQLILRLRLKRREFQIKPLSHVQSNPRRGAFRILGISEDLRGSLPANCLNSLVTGGCTSVPREQKASQRIIGFVSFTRPRKGCCLSIGGKLVLKKIVHIHNVGQFYNYSAVGDTTLSRYSLIMGANGYGKTTLCAILRSLKSGDAAHVVGRCTLGAVNPPTAKLLLSEGIASFNGSGWSDVNPNLEIFDHSFVTENVHSGDGVDISHKRNLYRVIIGDKGVTLAEREAKLAELSRNLTKEISAAAKAIESHVPTGMTFDEFFGLTETGDIDRRIKESEAALRLAEQAKEIVERPPLAKIELPVLPGDFAALLLRSIDDVAKDAELQISEHLEAHGMGNEAGNWLAQGLEFPDNGTCPFCGQALEHLSIVGAYRTVFGARYKAHRGQIKAMRGKIIESFGEAAVARLTLSIEQNKGGIEFWNRYCPIDPAPLTHAAGLEGATQRLGQAALELIEKKDGSPLDAITLDTSFDTALEIYRKAERGARKVAEATSKVNVLISDRKDKAAALDVRKAQTELAVLGATKVRYTEAVKKLCSNYGALVKNKEMVEQKKSETRELLDAHTNHIIKPYETRINHYLSAFNSKFRIAETQHSYAGGTAASTYQLVIRDKAVELGKGKTPDELPSFKNTLSAGDKMTLALAFFLAHLESDPNLANKTVVFDDPFTSQDAFRRRQTVQEIIKVGKSCDQVIVLSHDATFLEQIWDKVGPGERTALSISDYRSQGSRIMPVDLKRACRGRTAQDIDDLQTYLTTGEGNEIDLIRKMRGVLETFCWTHYPSAFSAEHDWLGGIVGKIREAGEDHPAWDHLTELADINDYTREYHHGEDLAKVTSRQIDQQELTTFVTRAVQLVNALQA